MNYVDRYSEDEIWNILSKIPDPEIPVITITELGVLRKVEVTAEKIIITVTPTYSGCPAMDLFKDEILKELSNHGISRVEIDMVYSPAWTTDWINEEAREKLRAYGIAPPIKGTEDKGMLFATGTKKVPCPRCKSENTQLKSQFGSTACKALYTCLDCLEPFDYFKCI